MAVNFGMLEAPLNFNEALDPVITAIDQWKKDKGDAEKLKLQQAHEAELARKDDLRYNSSIRRQDLVDARERAKQDLAERRYQGGASVANTQARQGIEAKIRAALAQGDQGTAEMLGKSYSEMDPATGNVTNGMQVQQLPPRVADPGAPPEPNAVAPAVEGPRISAQDAERADLQRSLDQPGEITTSRDARDVMQTGDEERAAALQHNAVTTADYHNQAEAYRAEASNPRFKIGDTEVDQNSLRYAAANKDASDFENYAGTAVPAGDPDAQAYVKMLAGAVRGKGMSAQQAAKSLDDYKRTGFKQDFTAGQNDARNETTLERQRIANQRPQASFGFQKSNADVKTETALETATNNFQRQWQVSNERFNRVKLDALANNPDVPIAQRAISGVLSRQLAGEKGVLTEQDIQRLQKNLAGWMPEIENWFSKGATGALDPQILKQLQAGINIVISERKQIDDRAKAAYKAQFLSPTSWFQNHGLGDQAALNYQSIFGEPPEVAALPGQAPASAHAAPGRQAAPRAAAPAPAKPYEVIPGVIAGGGAKGEDPAARMARLKKRIEELKGQ